MSGAVHLVTLAARTPVGLTAEGTAAAVRAGISRIIMHPFLTDRGGEPVCGGLLSALDPGIVGAPRLTELARGAIAELLAKLGPSLSSTGVIRVRVALPEPRPGFHEAESASVLDELRRFAVSRSSGLRIEPYGRGHAGGLHALAAAADRIAAGQEVLAIIGGVDSYFDFDTVEWLEENRQLNTSDARNGFPPGEAASFVALAGEQFVSGQGLPSLGVLRGWAVAREERLIKTDAINMGHGLAEAIAGATRALRLPSEAVDAVYCDINGDRYRSEEFGFAVLRLPGAIKAPGYVTPVDRVGDVGAASGALGCVLAARSWARGYASGPRALVCAGSEAGIRAAIVLQAPGGV
jgi:3-oxoacyl-[acyl-carrier-protein] synthase I